jgi:hypothetical protein
MVKNEGGQKKVKGEGWGCFLLFSCPSAEADGNGQASYAVENSQF